MIKLEGKDRKFEHWLSHSLARKYKDKLCTDYKSMHNHTRNPAKMQDFAMFSSHYFIFQCKEYVLCTNPNHSPDQNTTCSFFWAAITRLKQIHSWLHAACGVYMQKS